MRHLKVYLSDLMDYRKITIRHQNLNIEELKAENKCLKTELNFQRPVFEGIVSSRVSPPSPPPSPA